MCLEIKFITFLQIKTVKLIPEFIVVTRRAKIYCVRSGNLKCGIITIARTMDKQSLVGITQTQLFITLEVFREKKRHFFDNPNLLATEVIFQYT